MTTLLIYGSGGLGREVFDLAQRINQVTQRWSEIAFIDDFRNEEQLNGIRVYKFDDIKALHQKECVVAVGEPNAREKLYNQLKENNVLLGTLIDPTVIVSSNSVVEEGCIVNPFVLLATGSHIGVNTLIQSNVNIGHDITIGKHCVISSGVFPGGADDIGDKVYIGMGGIIKEKLKIGNNSIIGMGACVFSDIPPDVIVLGNPARIMRKNEDGKIFK